MKRLDTDEQFEDAYISNSTVYVRNKADSSTDRIGSLDAFNPIFVTVSGEKLLRDEYLFNIAD